MVLFALQELSRLLNGDNKTEVQPIFHVTMVLERGKVELQAKVELQPTIQSLFDMIHKVSRNLITVMQSVPRVALQITEKQVRTSNCLQCHGVEVPMQRVF